MFFAVSLFLQLMLICCSFFFPIFQGKNISASMEAVEIETVFTIMETVSSDESWRISYPNPCQSGSSWPGIQCKLNVSDGYFHVARLDFGTFPNPSCKSTAKFPVEIFALPHLESAFFFQCFTQNPTEILLPQNTNFTSPLKQLSLRSNSALVGVIPPLVSSLKSLQILTLSQNRLIGQIPAHVFTIKTLEHLDLSYNMLTGEIPGNVGNLVILVELDLSYNKLIGSIPSSLGNLAVLEKLDLSSNFLNGTIPGTFNQLQSLVFLALSNNTFSGDYSKALPGLQKLQYFLMDSNPIFASLPDELGQLRQLQEIRLSDSGYSGPIPSSFSVLTNLTTLLLQNNRLSGQIPAGLATLSHIYHLNLSRNFLVGVVPFNSTFMKRLGGNLDLSGNGELSLISSNGNDAGLSVCGINVSSSIISRLKRSQASLHCSNSLLLSVATIIYQILNAL